MQATFHPRSPDDFMVDALAVDKQTLPPKKNRCCVKSRAPLLRDGPLLVKGADTAPFRFAESARTPFASAARMANPAKALKPRGRRHSLPIHGRQGTKNIPCDDSRRLGSGWRGL